MGGAIGALYLEEHSGEFERAVLSSPMLQMNYGRKPVVVVWMLAGLSKLLHWDRNYVPGQSGFDGISHFNTSSCMSAERYKYCFELRQREHHYRTYGGTYLWTRAGLFALGKIRRKSLLKRIQIPVLLCQAGQDHMVRPEGQEHFAKLVDGCKLVRFPEAKHEIFNATEEIRIPYYEEVLSFMDLH